MVQLNIESNYDTVKYIEGNHGTVKQQKTTLHSETVTGNNHGTVKVQHKTPITKHHGWYILCDLCHIGRVKHRKQLW